MLARRRVGLLTPLILGVLVLFVQRSSITEARKQSRLPLLEESGRRKSSRQTHCQFGNSTYELEERWRPDLGPPFGVLYCVWCECVAVQRKKRIVARARCKNIKNDCPKPMCENPVLLPERCCKTCIGEDYADLEEGIASRKLEYDDDDKTLKEFSVLMTGIGVQENVPAEGAARGYLTYAKRDLHFTIHYSGMRRPTSVWFTNDEGNILEEHLVENVPHQISESKICGVWRKVPKVYRRLLQKDRMYMSLVTEKHPDGYVGGKILKNMQINTEVFSALLIPDTSESLATLGGGGIAMMSLVANSIYATIDFNGVFTSKDARDAHVVVSVFKEVNKGERLLMAETVVTLPKAHPDYNSISAKLDFSQDDQEKLAKERFHLRMTSADGSRSLAGPIMAKPTCNVFQAVVMPEILPDLEFPSSVISGYVLLTVGEDGTIKYKLHTTDANSKPLVISLDTAVETPSGTDVRRLVEVDQPIYVNSWANGTFPHTGVQEMEMLMTNDLMVTVATSQQLGYLRGRVRQRMYTEALLNEIPVLLSGGTNTSAAGMAWLAVDRDCLLHYQVYVAGLDRDLGGQKERHLLKLLEIPPGKYGMPQQHVLRKFDGEQTVDYKDELRNRTLALLHSGNTYLLVTSKIPGRGKVIELKARIGEIPVPMNCTGRLNVTSPHRNDHIYQEEPFYESDAVKCFYEGSVFDDGVQWKGEHEDCTMCSCQRGKVKCHNVVCPIPECDNPVSVPGECCPTCQGDSGSGNITAGCYFEGDKQFHPSGTSWHPYLPPFGFSECATCRCEPDTLTVKCEKRTCPPLTCPEKEAYRERPTACCKKCPNVVPVKTHIIIPNPNQLGDQASPLSTKETNISGGCKFHNQVFANGDEWHPTVDPFGQLKCFKCQCKDGNSTCIKKKCPELTCSVKVWSADGCCERCLFSGEAHHVVQLEGRRRKKKETDGEDPSIRKKWRRKEKRQNVKCRQPEK